jgi:adenylate kinase family enzyme
MKKVVVIGSGGSGKSRFSRLLGEILALPVVHLDKLFWQPNWTRTPEDEWIEIVSQEIAQDEWIMDGNFGGTRELRMRAADTIIFLDLPRWLCMWRILKRAILYRGKDRPDMAKGCNERFDPEFIMWVWNYRARSRARALAEIDDLKDQNVFILKSSHEVEQFLKTAELSENQWKSRTTNS